MNNLIDVSISPNKEHFNNFNLIWIIPLWLLFIVSATLFAIYNPFWIPIFIISAFLGFII